MKAHDRLPDTIRDRLAASPFNLCAACVEAYGWNTETWLVGIEEMEDMVRRLQPVEDK